MSTGDEIRNDALALPYHERAALARDLIISLESVSLDIDAETLWAQEIKLRSAAVHRGDYVATEWRESVERVREALSRRLAP